jgi:hypothetical protein
VRDPHFKQNLLLNMDRDEFLRQMIAELSRQQESDPQAFNQPKKLSPIEIYHKMEFDYPLVTEEQLIELTEALEFLVSFHDHPLSGILVLNGKFVDNICEMIIAASTNSTEHRAINDLYGVVFLRFPLYLLQLSKSKLSRILLGEQGGSWKRIVAAFSRFVCRSTSSFVSGINSSAFVEKKHVTKLIAGISLIGNVIAELDLIDSAGTLENTEAATMAYIDKHADTKLTMEKFLVMLVERYQDIEKKRLQIIKKLDEAKMVTAAVGAVASDPAPISTHIGIFDQFKNAWIHMVLLCRDLLIHSPIFVSENLPALCDSLLCWSPTATALSTLLSSPAAQLTSKTGALTLSESVAAQSTATSPPAGCCLFVMVMSQFCISFAGQASNHSSRGKDSSAPHKSSTAGSTSSVTVRDAGSSVVSLFSSRPSASASALSVFPDMNKHNGTTELSGYLGLFVEICEKMGHKLNKSASLLASFMHNSEFMEYLCSILELYSNYMSIAPILPLSSAVDKKMGRSAASLLTYHVDALISSRLIPLLTEHVALVLQLSVCAPEMDVAGRDMGSAASSMTSHSRIANRFVNVLLSPYLPSKANFLSSTHLSKRYLFICCHAFLECFVNSPQCVC